ncbi:hypothetical protein BH10PSE18_BH10PSE18_37210 [soil metagenome]
MRSSSRSSTGAGAALLCALFLASCGGGSDSSSTTDAGYGLTTVSCSLFTTQAAAQLYYEANKTTSASALDPDGNGVACESLATTTTTDTAAVVPTGIWSGTLGNGDGLLGVVFDTGESWFMRTQPESYGTVFPTWLAFGTNGVAAVNGAFSVTSTAALAVSGFGAAQSGTASWSATVTPSSSMTGTWTQGTNSYTLNATYQTNELAIPSVAALAGDFKDLLLNATATTATEVAALPYLTVSGDGTMVGQIDASCTFTGQIWTVTAEPAYRMSVYFSGTCPKSLQYASGIGIYAKTTGQLYMIASDNLGAAMLLSGTRQ